jgi:uncharacterized protein
MGAAATVLAWAGPILHAAAWLAVRAGRSIWAVTALVLGPVGAAALLVATPRAADRVAVSTAILLGLGAGAGLYLATAAFMFLVRRWRLLAGQASSLYRWREGIPVAAAVAVSALVVAPGEELLWRGVVQEGLAVWIGDRPEALAGLVAWGAYVAVNVLSGSVPIVLGAAVGGAAWAGLAVLTGGVVAPILCHAVWTGLMIVLPPVFSSEGSR